MKLRVMVQKAVRVQKSVTQERTIQSFSDSTFLRWVKFLRCFVKCKQSCDWILSEKSADSNCRWAEAQNWHWKSHGSNRWHSQRGSTHCASRLCFRKPSFPLELSWLLSRKSNASSTLALTTLLKSVNLTTPWRYKLRSICLHYEVSSWTFRWAEILG